MLSLGLLILLIYMLIKFSRTGLPRPTIDAKQKDKLSRWIALEKKSEKIDLVIFIIIMIILVCFAFKILMLGIWGFPAVLVLLAIILLFLRYKNYRWMIGFYDSLLGKLKLRK